MHIIIVEITNDNGLKALHDLEQKHFIKIMEEGMNSPALSGTSLNLKEFKNWIRDAEHSGSIDLNEANSKWKKKKHHLMNLSR